MVILILYERLYRNEIRSSYFDFTTPPINIPLIEFRLVLDKEKHNFAQKNTN